MPIPEGFIPRPVEEIARHALAASVEVPPERVPESLCIEVALGVGNREALARDARELGPQAGFDLVRFDTDRIAEFVFESSRPPVIAGASKILRDLNAFVAGEFPDWTLFSGGGEGLLLAPKGRGEEICRRIERAYLKESAGALGVTTASISVRPEEFLAAPGEESEALGGARLVTGTPALLSRLHDEIRRKKNEYLPERPVIAGDLPRCRSCRDRQAGKTTLTSLGRPDETGAVCDACHLRWQCGRDEIRGLSFADLIEQWSEGAPELARKQSYLGFLYADGNGMGALFGRLRSLADLSTLSREVTACFEGLREVVRAEVRGALPGAGGGSAKASYLDLLSGGDEVIWILPAALALHVAERLDEWLAKVVESRPKLREILLSHGRKGLSIGIGLAIAGLGHPVRYQYQLAQALQKQAKNRSYAIGVDESALDFEILTDSSPLSEDLKALRHLYTRTRESELVRTGRPYTCGELSVLRRTIELALERSLALSQLYVLAAGSHEGRLHFLNLLRYQIARKPAGERYQAWLESCGVDPVEPAQIERFFVHARENESALWIQDALELMPFFEHVNFRRQVGRP